MNSKLFYTFKDGIGQYDCYPDTRAEFIMRWRQNYVIGATIYQKHRLPTNQIFIPTRSMFMVYRDSWWGAVNAPALGGANSSK